MASITQTKLRSINWAREYLWEVVFHDAPEPFNTWFPAETVSQNVWSIDSRIVANLYPTPNMSSPFTFDVTFFDDIDHTLLEWLRNHVNSKMLSNGHKPRAYLEDAVLRVSVYKQGMDREMAHSEGLWVFPTGSMDFEGSNQSESASKQAQFLITGTWNDNEQHHS